MQFKVCRIFGLFSGKRCENFKGMATSNSSWYKHLPHMFMHMFIIGFFSVFSQYLWAVTPAAALPLCRVLVLCVMAGDGRSTPAAAVKESERERQHVGEGWRMLLWMGCRDERSDWSVPLLSVYSEIWHHSSTYHLKMWHNHYHCSLYQQFVKICQSKTEL